MNEQRKTKDKAASKATSSPLARELMLRTLEYGAKIDNDKALERRVSRARKSQGSQTKA